MNDFLKRLGDILFSLLGLFFLAPFFIFIAFMIKRDSPGPVFFRGKRAGLNGEPFDILKFRTMYEHPESYRGPGITGNGDKRVTPVGQWLRATKLNELPQLLNVLKGEMSLVGPRPEDVEIAATWSKSTRETILSIRPGVTSPASILYRDEESLLSSSRVMDDYLQNVLPDKLRLDELYVTHHSFLSDIDIILWTVVSLLPAMKNQDIPEKHLYLGPVYRITRRYLSWFVIDFLTVFFVVGLIGVLWRSAGPLHLGVGVALKVALIIALLFSVVNYWLGLHKIVWRQEKASVSLDLAFSSAITTLVLMALNHIWKPAPFLPQGLLFNIGVFSFLGFLIARYRDRLLTGIASRWLWHRRYSAGLGEQVLIVGAGEASQLAIWLLQKSKFASAFSIVGMVDDNLYKQGTLVEGYPILGTTDETGMIAEEKHIGLILYAISNIKEKDKERILALCEATPARLVLIPDLLETIQSYFVPQDKKRQA